MIASKALATYSAAVNDIPDTEFKVEILEDGPIKKVSVNGTIYNVDYNLGGDTIHSIIMNHKFHGIQISSVGDSTYEVKNKDDHFQVQVTDGLKKLCLSRTSFKTVDRQIIQTQMPGVIQKMCIEVGDEVRAGDPLCVLATMEMENETRTPIDRVVKEVYVNETNKVFMGDKMLVVE